MAMCRQSHSLVELHRRGAPHIQHDHPRDLRSWPRYDIYLNYTTALVGQGWADVRPELANPLWILHLALCVAALSYGLSIVLWRTHAGTRARWLAVSLVLPGAVLCVMEMSYWISRTYDGLWWQQILPAVVPLILMLDEMIMRNSRSLALQGPAAAATSTTAAVFLPSRRLRGQHGRQYRLALQSRALAHLFLRDNHRETGCLLHRRAGSRRHRTCEKIQS